MNQLGVCQFAPAFIDTPKGDLDGSTGFLSTPDESAVVVNSFLYPFGTSEQYPQIVDSNNNILHNTAHSYMECSNKGYCDRQLGECICFEGYEGSACQRMECPYDMYVNSDEACAGHGVCVTARELAAFDASNIYELWDQDSTIGCLCDAGYFGSACQERSCKLGFDPIYKREESSWRYANWSYVIHTPSASASIIGNYSIIFYDQHNQRWATGAIDARAWCGAITSALEELPNDVIPHGSVRCVQWRDYHSISEGDEPIRFRATAFGQNPYYGIKTTLAFPANPGKLKQIELDLHLDGKRPTLSSTERGSPVGHFIYPNGFSGEHTDYFSELCVDVDVSILHYESSGGGESYDYLGDLTPVEERLLQECLADADGSDDTDANLKGTGRVQGRDYEWDFGSKYNPHVVRLVDRTAPEELATDLCAGSSRSARDVVHPTNAEAPRCALYHADQRAPGFFVPIYYDAESAVFKLLTYPGSDYNPLLTTFSVFTTKGFAQMVSDEVAVYTSSANLYSKTVFTTLANSSAARVLGEFPIDPASGYTGNLDCETNTANVNGAFECLEKSDHVFFLDPRLNPRTAATNPKYVNLYTVAKIYRQDPHRTLALEGGTANSTGVNRIDLDMSINSAWTAGVDDARAYLFVPPLADASEYGGNTASRSAAIGGFRYVSMCANRGNCNTETGDCECFAGFSGDDCTQQNNIIT